LERIDYYYSLTNEGIEYLREWYGPDYLVMFRSLTWWTRLSFSGFISHLRSSLLPTKSRLGPADRFPAVLLGPAPRALTVLPVVTRATAVVMMPRRKMARVVTSDLVSLVLAGEVARPRRRDRAF
jgi:hypothetical protein